MIVAFPHPTNPRQELLEILAADFYKGRFPVKRQPVYEPWLDRWERWLDNYVTTACIQEYRGQKPWWLSIYRRIHRSSLYRRLVWRQF